MQLTAEQKRTAVRVVRQAKAQLLAMRTELVNLMISAREEGNNPDMGSVQAANDALEEATGKLASFIDSPTAQRWEVAK